MTIPPKLRVQAANRVLGMWLKLAWTPRKLIDRFETWLQGFTVLGAGTRVRFNGECCRSCLPYKGKMGTIIDDGHDFYDCDYHVHADGKLYERGDFDYACTNGFDVVEYR